MNLPIPFRLSRIDEPVPYALVELSEQLDEIERACDDIDRRLDAMDRQLQAL